jgi:hypothetical protein
MYQLRWVIVCVGLDARFGGRKRCIGRKHHLGAGRLLVGVHELGCDLLTRPQACGKWFMICGV